ncbi:MAG: hypothetical protein LBF84_01150 [Holosporales bacterium]|nr:hypothetical protein [Holosporales bacterium]
MYTVPIWGKRQNADAHFEFCFLLQKRILQSIVITLCVMFLCFVVALLFGSTSSSMIRAACAIVVPGFCPLFTLYNVMEDCRKNDLIAGQARDDTGAPKHLDFFEQAIVYFAEFLAILLAILYIKCYKNIAQSCITGTLKKESLAMGLGYLSIFVFFVASRPNLAEKFRHVRILRIFRRIFPYVFAPLIPVWLAAHLLFGNGSSVIFSAWLSIVIALFFRTIWRRKILAFGILCGASLSASILFANIQVVEQQMQALRRFVSKHHWLGASEAR